MPILGVPTSFADLSHAGLIKGAVGGVLEGYGALTGNQAATTLGHNVTSPVTNALGFANPGYSAGQMLAGYKPLSLSTGSTQPNSNTVPGGAGGGSGYATTSGAAPAAPAINPNQFQIDQINSSLDRLPTQLQIAQGNIQGQYNTNQNEINTGEQQAHGQYDTSTNQNHQQYVANKNSITDNASSGLHSLLRLLGMRGAGGSSDYLQSAPQAIARQASQQRSGAGQTFGQNAQSLDTNWNNYETGVGQSKQKLNDWLSQQLNSAQSQSDSAHSGLLQSLAGLQPSIAAAQPFIDQSNALLSQVDQLGKLNPTYDGKAPTYTAPSVASYQVNPMAPIQQNGASGSALDSMTSPFWSLLNKDKTKTAPAF